MLGTLGGVARHDVLAGTDGELLTRIAGYDGAFSGVVHLAASEMVGYLIFCMGEPQAREVAIATIDPAVSGNHPVWKPDSNPLRVSNQTRGVHVALRMMLT